MQKYQNTDEGRYIPRRIPLGTSALAVLVFACDGELTKKPRDRKPKPARPVMRKKVVEPVAVGAGVEP